MKKKTLATITLSIFLLTGISTPALAAKQVEVTLPTFDVTLNGHTIESEYNEYPLLVYKDITYFPMTYHYADFLGLDTLWSNNTLTVSQDYKTKDFLRWYEKKDANTKTAKASIAEIGVVVNGETIQNKQEEYPLLMYRDITYFPLTWRFAHDAFGWDYWFSHEDGLVISSIVDNTKNSVATQNESLWNGEVDSFASKMGTGELQFGVGFLPEELILTIDEAREQLRNQTIMLYHFPSDEWVNILPSDGYWEYQIYKTADEKEQLIYSELIPTFSGVLDGRQFAYSVHDIEYWNATSVRDGVYKVVLQHPEYLTYETVDGEIKQYLWKEGTGGDLFFESIVTIQ